MKHYIGTIELLNIINQPLKNFDFTIQTNKTFHFQTDENGECKIPKEVLGIVTIIAKNVAEQKMLTVGKNRIHLPVAIDSL